MGYFHRLKEIQKLQWDFLIDYWYIHLGMLFAIVFLSIIWAVKK